MLNPLTLGSLTGFITSTLISHPRSPVARYRPQISFLKKVQLLPQFKIFYKKEKAFVFHHWLVMAFLLALSFWLFQTFNFFRGFLMGGIGQGLTFRDRFEFRQRA